MTVSQQQIIDALRRIRGPDLQGNIVDLGTVSEILIRDGRVSFSITVPADRAAELEPLRQAAHKVVSELPGVTAATVVLTADRQTRQPAPQARAGRPRVPAARAMPMTTGLTCSKWLGLGTNLTTKSTISSSSMSRL